MEIMKKSHSSGILVISGTVRGISFAERRSGDVAHLAAERTVRAPRQTRQIRTRGACGGERKNFFKEI